MTDKEVLRELKALGTEQNRKIYGRHGVGTNAYGVSFAELRRLGKQIKVDQDLAEKLWKTGNHDARILATLIADPASMSSRQLDSWAKDLDNYVLTDAYAVLVSKTPSAQQRTEKWSESRDEWIGRAGWQLLALLAMQDNGLGQDFFAQRLKIIEEEIHTRKNRVRDAMNSALIAIGIRNPSLEKKALAAAARIGVVEVDHGETNCKTPDAADYIRRSVKRKRKKR